jgi:subtilisin family serine protease
MKAKVAAIFALILLALSLLSSIVVAAPSEKSFDGKSQIISGNEGALAKIQPSIRELATTGKSELVKVNIATVDPNQVFNVLRNYMNLGLVGKEAASTDELVTLTLSVPAKSLVKVASLPSVLYVLKYTLPEPLPPPDLDVVGTKPNKGAEPSTWFAIETHGAKAAWAEGYTGTGINVAVIDTGVDFANPDLQGRQARQPFGPYAGWPIAFDSRSMMTYLFSGGMAFPSTDIWYSDTSSTDTTGYVVTDTSVSGIYHIGLHPDDALKAWWYGNYVAVLVVDEHTAGVYDTVYVDLDNNKDFTNDKPCFKGDEIAWMDLTGDGLADISGGMVYFIADGVNPVPFSAYISRVYGISNVIPGAGNLVAFMINDATENGGDHGTLCASAVVAQGVISDGVVRGMAPDAKIIAVGNMYQGGSAYDNYRFVTRGYDGLIGTGDEANIVSMSYGTSSIYNDGWDYESRYLTYMTTLYNPYVTFLGATGNGGHGYGTVTSPASSTAIISVGASTEYWSFESIRDLDQITWGDVQPWSNRGPSAVGQVAPDVVAVGAWGSGDLPLNEVGDGSEAWEVWGGTSMSTPIAAGVTALMYQAYIDANGFAPTSYLAREIMMSSARNLNYDPLVQGAGMVDGERATELASNTKGILVSPTFWTAGNYQGEDYPAFAKIMYPGETATKTFTLTNVQQPAKKGKPIPPVTIKLEDSILVKVGEYKFSFSSDMSKESPYEMGRPDYLLDITKNIPKDTDLIKVFAYFPFDKMDANGDYTNVDNNGYRLLVYDWKDLDRDRKYWRDLNHNGVVNSGEMDPMEINRYTYGYPSGTALEASVQEPLERYHNGILVGIQHRYTTALAPKVPINIKVEFYKKADWNMLTVKPSFVVIPPGKSVTVEAKVTVPKGTPYGLYEGMIDITQYGMYRGSYRIETEETVVPVIVNVASSSATFEFGGTPPSKTLYDNGRVFGGFDWAWRDESGDWRFYYADIPESEVPPGTKLLVDVAWSTLPTDIDAWVYGPELDAFSYSWPSIYGPYTLDFKGGSEKVYMGSGIYKFKTTTGGAEEVISADAVPGLNLIALHNVLYNDKFGEPFTGKVGTFSVTPYPVSITTSTSTGTQAMSAVSSLDLAGITAMAYGMSQPEHFTGQTIYQDNPADPMTASWTKEYMLTNAGLFEVNLHVGANDLDLYILYDMNNDGVPESNEVIAQSTASAGIDEYLKMLLPPDGRYWVFVHGWAVVPSPSTFDIDITIIQGTMITVSGLPPGPVTAGTTVNFNLNYDLDGMAAGTYEGLIFVGPSNAPTAVAVPVEIIYTP